MNASPLFRLDGKVAVVTGAQGQLGPVWVKALLNGGARVAGGDLKGATPEPAVAELLAEYPDRFFLMSADVCDRKSLEALRDECKKRFGDANVLVNNAGVDQPASAGGKGTVIEEVPWEAFTRVITVNLAGTFQASQVFGAAMAKAGSGSIINIGSLYAALSPDPWLYEHFPMDPPFIKPPAYGPSKAGVINLTKYLATHWGPKGVRVNCLSPGGVRGAQDPEFQRKFCHKVPLHRMAEKGDLVGPLVFLASDASAYVTGIDLAVDGGYRIL